MIIALDTNAYSDFRRAGRWRDAVETAERVCIPLPVLAELRAGFRLGAPGRHNEAGLWEFLASPRVGILFPDETTTECYADFWHQLREQGTPIPTNDLWIAALVYQHHCLLCSSDEHFAHLPQVPRFREAR